LLSNAIKYSPEGSSIQFDLVCEDNTATFRIQDRGIGIPIEDQARLFEPFYRSSNVGTISGTGLGLAIAQRCVELQGGKVVVESEVGVGTTFTVTLPFNSHIEDVSSQTIMC
jgi:signal transduction histidine kinase